jgi:ABC-2 type transport system ATP-binding protein
MSLQTINSERPAVELNSLGKSFGSFRAIDGISISIGRGEVFGLLGPNGAGKTTTMRIISGLLNPTDGDVVVQGKSVRDQRNRVEISREIGLLTESPNVYERLTAEQNLVFFARAYGIPETEIQGRVRGVLQEFDLDSRRSERAVTFSKGMKQKLAIARALVHRPSILLLDEPTASLDAESAKTIRSQISETAKSGGHTVLLSTHNLDDASRLCQRIAFISHGKILACGTEEEVSRLVKRGGTGMDRVLIRLISSSGISTEQLSRTIAGTKSVIKKDDGKTIEISFDEMYSNEEVDVLTSKAVDCLVSSGAKIIGVEQSKPSLEDLYLEIVAGDRKRN